jgi:hypothetical protein
MHPASAGWLPLFLEEQLSCLPDNSVVTSPNIVAKRKDRRSGTSPAVNGIVVVGHQRIDDVNASCHRRTVPAVPQGTAAQSRNG